MNIQVIKSKRADKGFGDHACSVYTPASYSVMLDGREVATITGQTVKYMGSQSWTLRATKNVPDGGKPTWYFNTQKQARVFAETEPRFLEGLADCGLLDHAE